MFELRELVVPLSPEISRGPGKLIMGSAYTRGPNQTGSSTLNIQSLCHQESRTFCYGQLENASYLISTLPAMMVRSPWQQTARKWSKRRYDFLRIAFQILLFMIIWATLSQVSLLFVPVVWSNNRAFGYQAPANELRVVFYQVRQVLSYLISNLDSYDLSYHQ